MKTVHYLFIGLFILSNCQNATNKNGPISQVAEVESGLRPEVLLAADSAWSISSRMAHYGVPGVSLAVIKDHEIHWVKSYGVMDRETKEPVRNTTLFQAGSISKPVAAFGALKMVELGLIEKDKNVNDYLSSWSLPENEYTDSVAVTLEHLLSHTGGVTVHGFLGYNNQEDIPSLTQLLDGVAPANSNPIRVDKVPGIGFRYSGGGYCIMQQMVIDQAPENNFPEILSRLVLKPLAMHHSTYSQPLPAAQLALAATGYLPDGSMTKGKQHIYPEMAAAGLWTTAEDLARFAIELSLAQKGESEKVLSSAMAQHMVSPFIEDFVGMGIFLNQKENEIYLGHGGWDEGFSSEMIFHKDKGYGVVVLTNSNHPAFISELVRAVAQVYSWDDYLPPVYSEQEIDSVELNRISGRYLNNIDNIIEIYQEGATLYFKHLRDQPVPLFKVGKNTYTRRERHRLIHFESDTDEKTTTIVFDPEQGETTPTRYPKVEESFQVPFEKLVAGKTDEAFQDYLSILREDPEASDIQEGTINYRGYELLNEGNLDLAIALFEINTKLYPDGFNTFDSLGEAYRKAGNKELAILNYQKSLALNPENSNAQTALEELQS